MMDHLFENIGIVCGSVTAFSACAVGLFKYIILPTRTFVRGVADGYRIVKRELMPNGGSSLRDAVTRIDNLMPATVARSRVMLQHMKICSWESDAKGDCVYVSRELCRLTGRTQEETLGMGWLAYIHPDDVDRVKEEWDTCVSQHRDFSMNYRIVTVAGTVIRVHAEAYTLAAASAGVVSGFIGALTRVSDDSARPSLVSSETSL